MTRITKKLWLLILVAVALIGLTKLFGDLKPALTQSLIADPLPSWNDGIVKQNIIDFVQQVSDSNLDSYIPPAERIATFDNDGTLWLEKPFYVQLAFIIERIRELAPEHPDWENKQPFQGILTNDNQVLNRLKSPKNLLKLVIETHTGMSDKDFYLQVKQFLGSHKHPKFDQTYTKLIYQPMVELINYLKLNDFQVYICSGGGLDFIRSISEQAYGIPSQNIIASGVQKEWQIKNGNSVFIRLPKLVEPINDKSGKPVNILRSIGKKPVIAVGNSDGDIQMLQYADTNSLPNLELLLHHDDNKREYDYDQGTELALMLARENDWNIISIKQDFKQVFPFDKN